MGTLVLAQVGVRPNWCQFKLVSVPVVVISNCCQFELVSVHVGIPAPTDAGTERDYLPTPNGNAS